MENDFSKVDRSEWFILNEDAIEISCVLLLNCIESSQINHHKDWNIFLLTHQKKEPNDNDYVSKWEWRKAQTKLSFLLLAEIMNHHDGIVQIQYKRIFELKRKIAFI